MNPLPQLLCPLCSKRLDIDSWNNARSDFNCTCRNCLVYVKVQRLNDDDIRELASE